MPFLWFSYCATKAIRFPDGGSRLFTDSEVAIVDSNISDRHESPMLFLYHLLNPSKRSTMSDSEIEVEFKKIREWLYSDNEPEIGGGEIADGITKARVAELARIKVLREAVGDVLVGSHPHCEGLKYRLKPASEPGKFPHEPEVTVLAHMCSADGYHDDDIFKLHPKAQNWNFKDDAKPGVGDVTLVKVKTVKGKTVWVANLHVQEGGEDDSGKKPSTFKFSGTEESLVNLHLSLSELVAKTAELDGTEDGVDKVKSVQIRLASFDGCVEDSGAWNRARDIILDAAIGNPKSLTFSVCYDSESAFKRDAEFWGESDSVEGYKESLVTLSADGNAKRRGRPPANHDVLHNPEATIQIERMLV